MARKSAASQRRSRPKLAFRGRGLGRRVLQFLEHKVAIVAMPEIVACHMVSGEADYLLEVVVPDLEHYQRLLLGKLLNLPIIKEVRSNIAIQTLKAAAPLPLDHLSPPRPSR